MRQSLDKLQIMSNYSFHSEVEHCPRPQSSMQNNSQPKAPKGSLLSQTGQAQGGGLPSCPGPQPWRGHPRRGLPSCSRPPTMEGPLSKDILFLNKIRWAEPVILLEC